MLIYIGPRRQTHVIRHALPDERRPRWTGRTYSWLFRSLRLPSATYIFVGVDRLDMAERRLAAQFYRHINTRGPGFRALNDTAIGMGRYRLLRTLYQRGINQFNAYLATEPLDGLRWPVFVRSATMSLPPLTDLLASRGDLDGALALLVEAGHPAEDLLVIEHCAEPFAPGLFRKQAEYRFGDRYVPTASVYAAEWYVKRSTSVAVDDAHIDFDMAVLRDNPYADLAREVFAIAGVEYGRIDIGMVGGRPQVYELNFNPDMRSQRDWPAKQPKLVAAWTLSDERVYAALHAIDTPASRAAPTLTNPELLAFRLRFWRNYAPQRY